jgi:hypothetical protein
MSIHLIWVEDKGDVNRIRLEIFPAKRNINYGRWCYMSGILRVKLLEKPEGP